MKLIIIINIILSLTFTEALTENMLFFGPINPRPAFTMRGPPGIYGEKGDLITEEPFDIKTQFTSSKGEVWLGVWIKWRPEKEKHLVKRRMKR